jgi:hypothetical protein
MPHVALDREVLQGLVNQGLSQQKIADQLGVVKSDVRYWLETFNIRTQMRKEFPLCNKCGEDDPTKFGPRNKSLCRFCDSTRTTERFRSYKQKAVDYKGGKCQLCDNPSLVVLVFHHIDPVEKDENWPRMATWSFERIKEELDKTLLVCSNCHLEVHFGEDDTPIRRKYESIVGVEKAKLTYYRDGNRIAAYQRAQERKLTKVTE